MSCRGRHPHNRLTDRVARQARRGRHGDGNRLYMVVRRSGARSWVQRITIRGQRVDLGLGPYPLVSLADARSTAIENRLTVHAGGDPRVKAASGEGPTGPTFCQMYGTVTETRRTAWKSQATEAAWRRSFEKYVLPAIGKKLIAEVSLEDVRRIVAPHWNGRNSKGYLLRQNLECVFEWAVAANLRLDNPARTLARLLPKKKSRVRPRASLAHRRVSKALARWQDLDVREPVKLALLFIVLTAARLSEVTGATWGEIDFSEARWQVPAKRMKAGEGHTVPLSIQALEVLRRAQALKGDGSLIFPVVRRDGSIGPISQDRMSDALDKLGEKDPKGERITVHGFRSTFRVWSIEREHVSREIGEAALAHGESDATVAAYTRNAEDFDLRVKVMQRWADYVLPMSGRFGEG